MFAFFMFMLIIIPATMIIFGVIFQKKVPKKINYIYGYRTKWSMKSEGTWIFAHRYFGKLWFRIGVIIGIISIIILSINHGSDPDILGQVFYITIMAQIVTLLLLIIPTEVMLRRKYDENGRRIN